jgi:hypothetical protein
MFRHAYNERSQAMNEPLGAHVEIPFALAVKDGWPPVSVEHLPCVVVANGYRIATPPLFVRGISLDDVVQCELAPGNGCAFSFTHVEKSDHTTIWLAGQRALGAIEAALPQLQALGCWTVRCDAFGVFAVDVPGAVAMERVEAVFDALEAAGAAIAIPSFRHPK